MAFNIPPNTLLAPPSPAPQGKTLADVSAQGTTQGAPVTQISKGPMQPPAGGPVPTRPVVAAHANTPSVGTHPAASPFMRGNPPHGMTND